MTVPSRPESFAEDFASDWELWVLHNGLPELPDRVEPGESVPVAYWRSGPWAAVLGLEYYQPSGDEGPSLDSDAGGFRWTEIGWEPSNGRGGTNWATTGVELHRPPIGPTEVWFVGSGGYPSDAGDWVCGVAAGVAGTAITTIELEQEGALFTQAVDSLVGAWVVAFDALRPALIRLKATDAVRFERTIESPYPSP